VTTGQIVKTSRNQAHVHCEPQHNLRHQERNPMKFHDADTIPTIVNGQTSVSGNNKVNTKKLLKLKTVVALHNAIRPTRY